MQQLHKKYGYKFYNCTMEEWKYNFFDDYEIRKNRTAQETVPFEFLKFESVKQGIELIKNVFSINDEEPTILINHGDKYYLIELISTDEVYKKINDTSVKQNIIENLLPV